MGEIRPRPAPPRALQNHRLGLPAEGRCRTASRTSSRTSTCTAFEYDEHDRLTRSRYRGVTEDRSEWDPTVDAFEFDDCGTLIRITRIADETDPEIIFERRERKQERSSRRSVRASAKSLAERPAEANRRPRRELETGPTRVALLYLTADEHLPPDVHTEDLEQNLAFVGVRYEATD